MPAAIDMRSIIDSVFGCCLGRRQIGRGSSSNGASAGQRDERTPLLAGQRLGHADDQQSASGRQAAGVQGSNQAAASQDGLKKGTQQNTSKPKRKKEVNGDRLKVIRDQAQAAFFNIESSQLLPSSSSLAQRHASMGSSQRLNRRDQSRDRTGGEASYTAQQRNELISASDKAERLYKAAMKTRAEPSAVAGLASEDEGQAPVGLVRQVRLSVQDVSAVGGHKPDDAELNGTQKQVLPGTAATPKESPSRPKFTLQTSAGSASTDEGARRSFEVHKLPSVHSLRTLRLGVASPQPPTGDDDEALLGRSAQSTATEDDASKQPSESTDDERWEHRGRTRSRRGLVWMDTSRAEEGGAGPTKMKLDEIWRDNEHGAEDEIQYGLRFDVKHADKRKEINEHLKRNVTQPIAEAWDGGSET